MMRTQSRGASVSLASQYQQQGYVHVPQLFTEREMHTVGAEFERLFRDTTVLHEGSLRAHRRPSLVAGTVLDRLDPIIDLSSPIRELTENRRLLDTVETVLGEPALLFKDKAILKPPGAFGYRQHQDYTYWQELPVPAQLLLTALVAVDKSTEESGGLQLYPGLHHRHVGPEGTPSKIFSPDHGLIDDAYLKGTDPELIELSAGDVVLFCSLTPHCSEPNRSPHSRRSLFFSFSAASYGDQRDTYYRNLHRYLKKDRQEEATSPESS